VLPALLCLSLAAAPDVAATPPEPPDRLDVGVLPLVNYSSDTGVGFGAMGALYFRAEGYKPYRYGLRAQLFATTGGVQDHQLTRPACSARATACASRPATSAREWSPTSG
jgi:hypothetical protein